MIGMTTIKHYKNDLNSCETVEQINKLHEQIEAILNYAILSNDREKHLMAEECRLAAQKRAVEIMES